MSIDERDPIHNVIYGKHGIKAGIRLMYENQFIGQALILIFAGIDAMANIARPEGEDENKPSDFKAWTAKYIHIKEGNIEVTSDDLWSARNAIMHTYGVYSRDTRSNKAKIIGWIDRHPSSVSYNPDIHPDFMVVSIDALIKEFFKGVDQFLIDIMKDEKTRKLSEERLNELIQHIPFDPTQ
ncbi:MAG: hypothetical protein ACYC27_18760 [Armatimonadota bacterium]